jgi:hypothetical protein
MKSNRKTISVFLTILLVALLVMVVARFRSSSVHQVSTPTFIGTPAQDEHTQAFMTYISQLEQEGLVTTKEIRVEESQPFVFILKPNNTSEITDEDVRNVTELALHTVQIFESRGGLHDDDIDIAFHRPVEQKILLIKRPDMPELLGADIYSEITVSIDTSFFTSLINLAGPRKNGRQDFANTWAVIQAICISYAGDFPDVDPVCNIISANAAAGWIGIDQEQAVEIINSYGTTQLGYLGNKDYRYRFISFVYDEFTRLEQLE